MGRGSGLCGSRFWVRHIISLFIGQPIASPLGSATFLDRFDEILHREHKLNIISPEGKSFSFCVILVLMRDNGDSCTNKGVITLKGQSGTSFNQFNNL